MRNRSVGGLAVLAFAAACGGGGGGGGGGGTTTATIHCASAAAGECITLTAPAFTPAQLTALQGECSADSGTYGTGACSTTNAVAGTCSVTQAAYLPATPVSGMTARATFYTPAYDATSAAAECGARGTWSGSTGGGGTNIVSAHCTNPGMCTTYAALGEFTPAHQTALQTYCAGTPGGTYGTGACNTLSGGVVAGTCTVTSAAAKPPTGTNVAVVNRVYLTPSYDATTAAAACGSIGTWIPAGGGGGGGTQTVVSCTLPNVLCTEIRANPVPTAYETAYQTGCESAQGTVWATAGCPTAGAVAGYCRYDLTVDLGVSAEQRDYFYGPAFTSATAAEECTSDPDATWVP